ncbi:putative pleckstrin domain protein [Caulobacter phage CcrRogue]|uniref:Putative pleckstrin domain protein n=1 Tax=Caulobacter phage CcrRogue TaxID=2927986 RepID=K4JSM4_9CAUD|nr:putative pleckstrin domain protein [Caulobacter phage CcrRogue]AFU86748.1 putative pleckstrin domain protein [Caulobacter phage CcrRogue]
MALSEEAWDSLILDLRNAVEAEDREAWDEAIQALENAFDEHVDGPLETHPNTLAWKKSADERKRFLAGWSYWGSGARDVPAEYKGDMVFNRGRSAAATAQDMSGLHRTLASCKHPQSYRIEGGDNLHLPRYPAVYGSYEVHICRLCRGWKTIGHGERQWHEGPYFDAYEKAMREEEERC